MKVRFLQSVAGPRFSYEFDEVAEVPQKEAVQWIRNGVAEAVKAEPRTAQAQGGAETATARARR